MRLGGGRAGGPDTFCSTGHEFTDLQFRVLPHFKGSHIILLEIPALNVTIHPCLNSFTMGDCTIQCKRKSRRISCLIVDNDKMNHIYIIAKHARNKIDLEDVFLISLQFVEELTNVKSDFGEQFDQQLKHLIIEFADVTEEPQGLPPHRGHLDYKVKLTG